MGATNIENRGGFSTPLERVDGAVAGPWRSPRQMLAHQEYDGHASIHDSAMAEKLGFRGAPIEGPTHFTQFEPICAALWGEEWFRTGCLSSHYRSPVVEGEKVRAFVQPADDGASADIWMRKEDGTEVLRGSASIGANAPASALDRRLATLPAATDLDILADVKVGMRKPRGRVRMGFAQHMGALYPFSLQDKLQKATEITPWWAPGEAADGPWKRAIIPFEMVSVLCAYTNRDNPFPVRGKAVGLFADQEIRMIDGPLFVDEDYEIEQEVVALTQSRRTESMWVRTNLFRPGGATPVASMLLNSATLRGSQSAVT